MENTSLLEKTEKRADLTHRYLTERDRVEKYENNLVSVIYEDGERVDALEPRRLFPTTRPTLYITLLNNEGKEEALIRNISDLSPDSRAVIEESLANYYLVPKIIKIYKISIKTGTIRWSVLTERGKVEFYVHNRNDVKSFSDGSVRLRDSDDNRYIIENISALDLESRAKLAPHI